MKPTRFPLFQILLIVIFFHVGGIGSTYAQIGKSLIMALCLVSLTNLSFGQEPNSDEPYVLPGTQYVQVAPAEAEALRNNIVDNPDLVVGPCEEFNIVIILDAPADPVFFFALGVVLSPNVAMLQWTQSLLRLWTDDTSAILMSGLI